MFLSYLLSWVLTTIKSKQKFLTSSCYFIWMGLKISEFSVLHDSRSRLLESLKNVSLPWFNNLNVESQLHITAVWEEHVIGSILLHCTFRMVKELRGITYPWIAEIKNQMNMVVLQTHQLSSLFLVLMI